MSGTPFFKMTGAGNDFVFVDGRKRPVSAWAPEEIQAISDRRNGVGADGLVVLTPEAPGAVRMTYFNSDGSRAGMCGNAALCSTRLAARLELADPSGMALVTDTGVLESRCVGPGWAAEIRLTDFESPAPVDLALGSGELWMSSCTVGVPHLIVGVENLGAVDVDGRGRELRYHPAFAPGGVNVNFLGRAPEAAGVEWQVRTYERGVEAETMACGTGTVGAAFALAVRGLHPLPVRIASWSGLVYSVAGKLEGGLAVEPWLCGEGRLVFEGNWPEVG